MTIKVTYNVTDVYVSETVSATYINVSYETPTGAGAVWGTITGTLSNQTDLQNALNLKVPYTGATTNVNLGGYDLLVQTLTIGKGNNSLVNNTALGCRTLFHTTTGNFNTAVGYEAGHNLTTGQYNTAIGQSSMFTATTAGQNTAVGLNSLLLTTSGGSNVAMGVDALQHNTTGSSNTALGYNAGSHITGGSTPNTTASNSVFIGRDSKPLADGQTNQIVIGQNAVGNGSNTATFGNTATTANYFTGSINGGSFVKSGGLSTQYLKADGSVSTLTNPITGTGVSGQVAYWSGTNTQTGSNNLFWDATNNRLGVKTNTPTYSLSVNGGMSLGNDAGIAILFPTGQAIRSSGTIYMDYGQGGTGDFIFRAGSSLIGAAILYNNGYINLALNGQKVGINQASPVVTLDVNGAFAVGGVLGSHQTDRAILEYNTNKVALRAYGNTSGTGFIALNTGGGGGTADSEKMRLTANGRLLLGTTTEGTQLLQVNGTGYFASNVSIGTTVSSAGYLRNYSTIPVLALQNSTTGTADIDGFQLSVSGSLAYVWQYENAAMLFGTNATERMRLDASGNLGLGVTPSAWNTLIPLQIARGSFTANNSELDINHNAFYDGTWKYIANGFANNHYITGGAYIWRTAPSGTAGNAITFTQPMTLTANGRLLLGTTTEGTQRLQVEGDSYFSGSVGIGTTSLTGISLAVGKNISGAGVSYGILQNGQVQSSVGFPLGIANIPSVAASLTINAYRSFYTANPSIGAGSTITELVGYHVESNFVGGTSTFAFQGAIPSGTGRWNLYMNGTADNFISGNTQIGTGSFTSEKLQVNGTMKVTGASTFSSSVQAGGGTTNASAILQADSTTSGFLPPRMTTAQKIAITSPATGLQVYDTTLNQNAFYNGTAWVSGGGGGGIVNFVVQHASLAAYADSTTYYFGGSPTVASTAAGVQRGIFNKNGTAKSVYLIIRSAATPTTEAITLTLFKATGAGALSSVASTTFSWSGTNNFVAVNWTGLSVSVTAGDSYELSVAIPAMAGNPSNVILAGNIEVEI